jgi:hypothetical protein
MDIRDVDMSKTANRIDFVREAHLQLRIAQCAT